MTNLEILYTIQHIAQLLTKPLEMSLEQFNNLLQVSQDDVFKEFADGYSQGNGLQVNSRMESALAPFKSFTNYTSGSWTVGTQGFGVSAIVFNQIAGLYKVIAAWSYDNADDYPDKLTPIDIVTESEAAERMGNAITYPSEEYPIMVISGGTVQFVTYVIPSTFTALRVCALSKPLTPSLVITLTNGVATQSGSSVDLQLTSMFHVDVIRKILQYLGISIGNEFITQVVEQQKMNTR